MASLLASTITTHPYLPRTRPATRTNKIIRTDRTRSARKVPELLYDDGYTDVVGSGDYLNAAADLRRTNSGPPRWLCHVECGPPLEGSPVLLFLPGINGIGMGLFMHHKALRRGSHFRVAAAARKSPIGGLSALYDDGFGSRSAKDYLTATAEMMKQPDDGTPRWFCPAECGQPVVEDSPLLMFLPGVDGSGMGLILHHTSLGKVFEVRCLHIPVHDRTPFEGLVKLVENSVKHEHALSPNRPIYLVGETLGGCLALSVAARNPSVDLILVLVNPATSYDKSHLQNIIPLLEALPHDLHTRIPDALSIMMGDHFKSARTSILEDHLDLQPLHELSKTLSSLLPLLSDLTDIITKDMLLWKLELLKSGSVYANLRLHAVGAEVLVIASGKDIMLPSGDEAHRLLRTLKNCRVRYFKDNGHTILLEDGINLLTVIKGTSSYRRSRQHDFVTDYIPPTISEFIKLLVQDYRVLRHATSPVMLSTLEDGRIVRGLGGVPSEGPVLFVGYHMLLGLELISLYEAFLREKNIVLRGMAHPFLFTRPETSREELSPLDVLAILGGLPVSLMDMYRLFSGKSFILLYPGGVREALHRKGEEYKLFWPDHPEFVRMAARFEATIVPFGVVGEDDVAEILWDYNDLMNHPFSHMMIKTFNKEIIDRRLRIDMIGEVSEQDMHLPGILPKLPGRFYYLFGKPWTTRGTNILKDREGAYELYSHIKTDVEGIMSYLKKKREEDPYRSAIQRAIFQSSCGHSAQVPTFEP